MKDNDLSLRPMRISDGPFINNGLKDEIILKASGLNNPINSSWFSVWWWIKKTFMPCYCIECDSKRIGFIGLYNLSPGKSAEMSLAIFNETLRRHGYGTRAFRLLVQGLKRYSVVKNLLVKVETDNHAAISFWRKLGFIETEISDGVVNMSLDFT
jgi:RimJ/RimL family protein N-acetyltransferase